MTPFAPRPECAHSEERMARAFPAYAKADRPRMPRLRLDPRHHPDRPEAATPLPTREDLCKCLCHWLPKLEAQLKRRFPAYVVTHAVEHAELVGLNAILGDLHDRMKPEAMTSAGRRAWLFRVAVNAALSLLRQEKRRARTLPLPKDDLLLRATEERANPQDRELVLAAMEQLPPDEQEVIEAVYFADLTRREYAELLGVCEATVRRRLVAALAHLKVIFEGLSKEF
jgi:RNA polymerase sigma factor (sigma-70 family)